MFKTMIRERSFIIFFTFTIPDSYIFVSHEIETD